MYSPEKAILEALIESGGCWTGDKSKGRYDTESAFKWLYENEYIRGMGADWNTAIFCITDKGRMYLKELEGNK
jgi:hypothetical protein